MRFGASTYFFLELSVTEALDKIARLGLSSAEIWMEHYRAAGQRPAAIVRRARAVGLQLTLHAASYDLNIISANSGIRRESMQQIRSSLAVGAELGVTVVVVHPGSLSSSKGDVAAAWQSLTEVLALLDEWAEEFGLKVGLENMEKGRRKIFVTPQDIECLLAHPWRNIRLTLDLAHMQTLMDAMTYLKQVKPEWICHVHLSDNNPGTTHLPLGHGQLPVAELLTELATHYSGIVSLEGYQPGEGEALLAHNVTYLLEHGFIDRA